MRVLNAKDLAGLYDPARTFKLVEEAFAAVSRREATSPAPGVWERKGGVRLFSVPSAYLLYEAGEDRPSALLDAGTLIEQRPAAVSAVATRWLARDDAHTLALFGTGVQARRHLAAIALVREIRRVLVVGRTGRQAQAFVADMAPRFKAIKTMEASERDRAAGLADILCACTDSTVPVFLGGALRKGCHVNAIGNAAPAGRELDAEALRRAKVIVEDKERLVEGSCEADLGEVVGGKVVRRTPDDITVFKSWGLGAVDLFLAEAAWRRALAERVGQEVFF